MALPAPPAPLLLAPLLLLPDPPLAARALPELNRIS